MAAVFAATGDRGEVLAGLHLAVWIGRWSLNCNQDTIGATVVSVSGAVVRVDEYWSTQLGIAPTVVRVWMGKTWWEWQARSAEISGGKINVVATGQPRAIEVADW